MHAPIPRSIWHQRSGAEGVRHPALAQHLNVECVVVGAGITGLTLAALLSAAGRRVAVLERGRIASGTTGSSSAHLTYALDTDYRTLVSRFGDEAMRNVIQSIGVALDTIEHYAT